jgi:hypothetical protein
MVGGAAEPGEEGRGSQSPWQPLQVVEVMRVSGGRAASSEGPTVLSSDHDPEK